jgi:hypothetical protein
MQRLLDWVSSALRGLTGKSAGPADQVPVAAGGEPVVPPRRHVVIDSYRVELDLTSQVLAIEATADLQFDLRGDAKPHYVEAPLNARLSAVDSTDLVSASVLAHKAKVFDDGLMAALEVAAQQGVGRHLGKAGLLAALGRALAGDNAAGALEAQGLVLGAAQLGRVAVPGIPPAAEARAQRAVEAFLADQERSTPIGFYTWSQQLAGIFQQDRMLQGEIETAGAIEVLVRALSTDPTARAAYELHLQFVSRLTSPFAAPDLRGYLVARDRDTVYSHQPGTRFIPPSVAHETEIVKKLYGDRPIPEGFVLADEMIRQIRSRELDLVPHGQSGWYDYQTWALEALVVPERMPEGGRLELGKEYRKLLLELFKGLLASTRETHVKQLERPRLGYAPRGIDIGPALTVEPLATFYLRRALGYRYVRGVIEDAFGSGQLARLHRLTPDGPLPTSLAEELEAIETLFLGAHVTASRELGLYPSKESGSEPLVSQAARRFAHWAGNRHSDRDLSVDLRAMVPIFHDVARGKTKVWAFLGWSSRLIEVRFAQLPQVRVLDLSGRRVRREPEIEWGRLRAQLPYPVTEEMYVDRLLGRDEFRSLCDSCGGRSEIIKRLGSPLAAA